MAVAPEQYARFERSVELKVIMEVVADRFGRDAADQIAQQALAIAEGRQKAPAVVWPQF